MAQPYRLDAPAQQIAAALAADASGDVWQGGSVAPGGYAPVVVQGQDRVRRLVPRQWGVPPPPGGSHVITHLRNLASPFWIGTLRHTQFRCLVPATRFPGVGGARGARWTVPSSPVFAFAGFWRDSEVPSFAILTTDGHAGSDAAQPLTMPVILHPEDYSAWLGDDWKQAQRLVSPYPPQLMRLEGG